MNVLSEIGTRLYVGDLLYGLVPASSGRWQGKGLVSCHTLQPLFP